jgi:hypothetical protein
MRVGVRVTSRRLQPVLLVDPRDRDTWLYPEWLGGRVVCDRCRRVIADRGSPVRQFELGLRPAR